MKKTLLAVSVAIAGLGFTANAVANEEVVWTCSDSKQFKTTGNTEKNVFWGLFEEGLNRGHIQRFDKIIESK